MNLTSLDFYIFTFAVLCVAIGAPLYLSTNPQNERHYSRAWLGWTLISLSIVFAIFRFFPSGSEAKGEVWKFTVSGVFGGFILLLLVGRFITLGSLRKDAYEAKIKNLNDEIGKKDTAIAGLTGKPNPLPKGDKYVYTLNSNKSKQIILLSEYIQDVKNVDVLVSSENTHMFMSRRFDKSVSGAIRNYGGEKGVSGEFIDLIADDLAKEMKEQAISTPVDTASVIVTTAGALAKNEVKKIFHAASVEGTPGYGFRVIQGLERCIINALEEASKRNFKTIAFPLLGSGHGGGDLKTEAPKFFQATIAYLEGNLNSSIERVYFLVLTKSELDTCQEALKHLRVTPV